MGGTCVTHGEGEKVVQTFRLKNYTEEPFWRPERRWEDNIKIDPKELE